LGEGMKVTFSEDFDTIPLEDEEEESEAVES
jgi:hypothetical protein